MPSSKIKEKRTCSFMLLVFKESLVLDSFSSKVPQNGKKRNALQFSFLLLEKKMDWWINKCHFLRGEQWKARESKVKLIQNRSPLAVLSLLAETMPLIPDSDAHFQ